MSEKKPRPVESVPTSGFTSDAWAKLAVTSSGRVVQKTGDVATEADTKSKSSGERKPDGRVVAPKPDVTQRGDDAKTTRQDAEMQAPSPASKPTRPLSPDLHRGGQTRHPGRRPDGDHSGPKRSTVLLRFPFFGELVRCNGNVATLRNDIGEGIAHVRSHYGRDLQAMDGLDGKHCALAIGGSPVRYREGKSWEHAVVQWILLDTLEEGLTSGDCSEARRAELATLDRVRLLDLLTAKWYVTAWEQKTGEKPKALLHTDDLLDGAVDEALASCSNLEELIRLLGAICTSPYYAIDAAGRQKACKRFFQPAKWDLRVFIANRPPEECRFHSDVWPLCGTVIQEHMNRARTVAIDLEAEGRRIWEYGWKNAVGVGRRSDPKDLSDADLQAALQESLLAMQSPCIVGHNLLNWDLLRLQERNLSFPERSELWDTLLAAWILKPWERSHALIVEEHGHRADADAAKCYELFEEQMAALAPCLNGQDRDIRRFVDSLFDGRAKLSGVKGRQYPADLQKKTGASVLYPRSRLGTVAWQQGCLVLS